MKVRLREKIKYRKFVKVIESLVAYTVIWIIANSHRRLIMVINQGYNEDPCFHPSTQIIKMATDCDGLQSITFIVATLDPGRQQIT